ncbi:MULTISPECIES: hypothetical protein [unclassified Pseudomonas]|nr:MULTISPECIES: hypothetical protein [unclassified Pseudomonas]MEB0046408.1 hypothetical protein [Pseudomonas sp. Dout3]MEB0097667.1 hypothetical protein [Pseudomonas sp. DC1.2]WPX61647.1 hypothetical protein RHM68_19310 [Pseudomonas sp. DC1.2]
MFLCVGLINFAGIFVWIGVCLHLAYTRMDEMLEHLKNCSTVMARAPLRHGGPWGKLLLIGGISGIVTFPGIYLKHGGVSPEDLNNFPSPLKRKLAVLQWIGIMLLSTLLLLFFFGKYTGAIK